MIAWTVVTELVAILASGGVTTWWVHRIAADLKTEINYVTVGLHERIDTLESKLKSQETMLQLQGVAHAANAERQSVELSRAAKDIKFHLETHAQDLRDGADRLRAHAQELHDQSQSRAAARTAPSRGTSE